uniref:complement C1q and tumor necrosis factor-related protein 9-like n=1 Tax=Semicossyphus pulcher TaxID=241346 RepID=UPI0037E92187
MLCGSDGAMLSRLLGLLVLSSLCSAMLVPDPTNLPGSQSYSEEEQLDMEHDWPPAPRSIPPSWAPDGNMTDGSNQYRMLGAVDTDMPPMPDTTICDIMLNQPVPLPIDQIPFFCLCSHCKGTAGPKGDSGDRGPPGSPGSPGRRGMTGFKGRPGFTGQQGIKGQKGDLGDKGQPGTTGFTGMKGGRGLKGEKGDQGMEGPPGAQGIQGETGTCPATCETVQGPQGPQGVPGPAGGRGLPGVKGSVGPKGGKGIKGDMGTPGDPGLDGQKGDQGEKGMCECTDGADGSKGDPGPKGDNGAKGDTGAPGVKGDMGLKGSEGGMGHMGPPGPCSPTIQSAFSACINQSYPIQDKPVPFQKVLTNEQGHFNPHTGVYTAPVNGTYVFSFHLAVYRRQLKVGFFLNFYPVVRNTESTDQSTTSQTIILHLASQDRVWLQVKDGITNGMYTDSESSSTFMGYLLYPDSCDMPLGRNVQVPKMTEHEGYGWDGPKGNPVTTPQP